MRSPPIRRTARRKPASRRRARPARARSAPPSAPRAPTSANNRAIAERLPFVQFELAGTVGLGQGRYLARDPERVLVVTISDAPEAPRRRLRKAKPKALAAPSEPSAVPVTLLTAVRPQPLGDEEAAGDWLEAVREDEDLVDAEVNAALVLINGAVHAHRVASLDGHLADVSPTHALAVRIGFGDGEGLADGRWQEAVELPRGARRKRAELLAPQEKVAAILGGRDQLDAATGALLHARADLDAERVRDCALQLRVGLEAMLADRETFGSSGQEHDLAALEERREITGAAANEALRGALGGKRSAEVAETLKLAERVLRRRRAYG